VAVHVLDLAEPAAFAGLNTTIQQRLGQVDVALVAHGSLPDQRACERDAVTALREFNLNGSAVIALLTHLANILERQRQGVLAVVTSVAGDRGRPSNYLYGSAKAAVSVFCEGLRVRLFRAGVHLIEIRPGFVDTPMTEALSLPRPLVSTPAQVAGRIVRAIARRRDVLYAPAYWAFILGIIRALPRPVFKRLNL